ncbi:MAG: hypothetical protein ACLGSD_08125 [Acidobacteriota bacterium]
MNRDRQTILALVAAGRINAAEAERLLAAASDAHEMFWIAAVCALAAIAPLHWTGSGFAPIAQNALHAAAHTLHHILTLAVQQIGGRP